MPDGGADLVASNRGTGWYCHERTIRCNVHDPGLLHWSGGPSGDEHDITNLNTAVAKVSCEH